MLLVNYNILLSNQIKSNHLFCHNLNNNYEQVLHYTYVIHCGRGATR